MLEMKNLIYLNLNNLFYDLSYIEIFIDVMKNNKVEFGDFSERI